MTISADVIPLSGIPIHVTGIWGEWQQRRFPRTKKRRIRKKWARRKENGIIVHPVRGDMFNGTLICTPPYFEILKEMTEKMKATP